MKARVTDAQAFEIRHAFAEGWKAPALARRFGVSTATVYRVVWGERCPDAGGPIAPVRSSMRGEKNPSARLAAAKVAEVRRRYARGGVTQAELAREFGVNDVTVSAAVTGKTWRNAGGTTRPARPDHRGEMNGRAKLTAAKVVEMREAYARGGVTQAELAREFGVSEPTAQNVITGKTWRRAGGPIAPVRSSMRGEQNPAAKLSVAKIAEIFRARLGTRAGYGTLARRFGVTKAAIRNVLKGKNWIPAPAPDATVPAVVKLAEGVYRVYIEVLTIPSRAKGQRRLVDALIEAGPHGLSVAAMQAVCRGYWKALALLRSPGSAWSRGILPPDVPGRNTDHWRIDYTEAAQPSYEISIMSGS